jgi:hypothetical protein
MDAILWRVSDLMLKTIYLGYGVQKMHVYIEAPLLYKFSKSAIGGYALPEIFREPKIPPNASRASQDDSGRVYHMVKLSPSIQK